jgi:hypothetical protein
VTVKSKMPAFTPGRSTIVKSIRNGDRRMGWGFSCLNCETHKQYRWEYFPVMADENGRPIDGAYDLAVLRATTHTCAPGQWKVADL